MPTLNQFIKDEIMKNKDNSKQLWRVLKRVALIMSNSNTPPFVEINGKTVKRSKEMVDGFNKYFTDIPLRLDLPKANINPN